MPAPIPGCKHILRACLCALLRAESTHRTPARQHICQVVSMTCIGAVKPPHLAPATHQSAAHSAETDTGTEMLPGSPSEAPRSHCRPPEAAQQGTLRCHYMYHTISAGQSAGPHLQSPELSTCGCASVRAGWMLPVLHSCSHGLGLLMAAEAHSARVAALLLLTVRSF